MLSACPASMTLSIVDRGGEPAEGLFGRLRPEHEPVWLVEELLDRGLELGLRAEVRHPVPVVLLQSVRGPDGDREARRRRSPPFRPPWALRWTRPRRG